MPKQTLIINPDAQAAAAIFGEKSEILKPSVIDRLLRLTRGTTADYMARPYKIPLDRFAALCELLRLSDDQILQAVKSYYKKGRIK